MKKWSSALRCIIVFLSFLLVFPAGVVNAAATKATIKHEKPGETYIPGFRINLDAQLEEPAGILVTRCYFKTKNDKNFAFVKMASSGDGNFKATLPAPFVGSVEVEYLFVSVSKEKKVTRTEIFSLKETETKEGKKWKDINEVKEVKLDQIQDAAETYALMFDKSKNVYAKDLPSYQTATPKGSLEVGIELPKQLVPLNGFYDMAVVKEVPAMDRYGLVAKDLYAADAISAAGGASASGATGAGIVTTSTNNTMLIGGIALVAVAGGVALALGGSSGSSSSGGGGGGLTTADLVASWNISGAGTDWHSAVPYVLNSNKTWSGMASSQPAPVAVNGTWSFNESAQTLTLDESSAGDSATISAGAITGNSNSFTVSGVLPVNPYTNNAGTLYPSQAPDTFTFTK